MSAKIVGVVGNSSFGKTFILKKPIHNLTTEKLKLAIFKHTHHKKFQFDFKGKDNLTDILLRVQKYFNSAKMYTNVD